MRQNELGLPDGSPGKTGAKSAAGAAEAVIPAVPRQYTSNTALTPAAVPAPAQTAPPAGNGAGGAYNAAANRFIAPVDPQVRLEQERTQAETDRTAAQRVVRTDPWANGSAAAAQNRPAQSYAFDPYNYSPDADLHYQATGGSWTGQPGQMPLPAFLDYLIRKPVGGAAAGSQNAVNSFGYLSQRMAPDREAEDAIWMDFQNGFRDSDAWRAALSETERRALETDGQDPCTRYRQYLRQEAQDRHRDDTPVQIADWGDRYRAETERRYGDARGLVRFIGDVGESIGAVLPAAALHAIPAVGPLLSGGYIFSSAAGVAEEKALQEGATLNDAVTYGILKGTSALLTEHIFDGLAGMLGKGATDKLIENAVTHLAKTPEGRQAINTLIRASGEGAENLLEDLLDPFLATVYTYAQYSSAEDYFTPERVGDMLYDFLLGATVGGVFQSTRTRRYERGDMAEAVVVDNALEAFLSSDSADAVRALARESPGELTNGLSDQGAHGKIQTELIPTHSQTRSRREMQALTYDIQQSGIREPVKYVVFDGKKYIVDGHHRLIAARRLGLLNIPAEEVELPYLGYQTTNDLLWFD